MKSLRKTESILKRADELQKEANGIIDDLGILEVLKEISEPSVVGSAKNGLMVCPDIDIKTYMKELDIYKVLDFLKELALLPTIQKAQFIDWKDVRRDHLPEKRSISKGYYVGLRSVDQTRKWKEWKIDIWFGKRGEFFNEYEIPENKEITREEKILILKLKEEYLGKKGYKDGLKSVDFYKAVLDNGVKNQKEFEQYINNLETLKKD